MDPVTHAASGAVAFYALSRRPATLWAAPLAALACASPDIDLCFIKTPLEFLMIHRGISHSLAFAPFFALLLALCCWPMWRKSTPGAWSFKGVWLFCIGMILLHIWLDVVTTYGTMIFLPFSHYRVRLNSIFIIDLLITLPLLWAVWRWRAKRGLILLTLAWIFIFPASGIAINYWHTTQCESRFADEGRHVSRLHVLPDAFAPFFWRVIFEEEKDGELSVRDQSLNFLGHARAPETVHKAVDPDLVNKLEKASFSCAAYFKFAVLPVMTPLRAEDRPADLSDAQKATLLMFYDLRFGSGIEWVIKAQAMRPNADIPFQLMTEISPGPTPDSENMRVNRVRLRFTDSGRDSQWHKPDPPLPPSAWQWLLGIRYGDLK